MVVKDTEDGEAEFVVSDALRLQVREALFSTSSSRPIFDIPATDESILAEKNAAKELLASANDKQQNKQETDRKLEARKQSEIDRIKAVRTTTTDPDVLKELDDLIDKIESAQSINGLNLVLASVSATVSAALGKADDKSLALDPLHNELYSTDAVYRKRVDEITDKSKVLQDEAKQRRETSDEIAKKHGIETIHDKAMSDLLKEYDGLEDKKSQKARELELKILLKELDQNEARIKQLEAKGLNAEAEILRKNTPPIDEAIAKATQNYQDQQKAYYEAYKKWLEKESKKTPEAIAEELEKLVQQQKEDFKKLTSNTKEAPLALQKDGERLKKETDDLVAAENAQKKYIAEPKTKEEIAQEQARAAALSKSITPSNEGLPPEPAVQLPQQAILKPASSAKQFE